MKIDSNYKAIVLYLNHIAKFKKCEIEDIIISNPKKVIPYISTKSKREILLYKRFFDVKMENENVLKRLYFSALTLKEFIHKEYQELLFELMLIYIFSYLSQKNIKLSEEFKKRTLNKILMSIKLDKNEEFFGKYGLYFLFTSLIRNKIKGF